MVHQWLHPPLTQSLGWPTISNLIQEEIAALMYKSLNELSPEYLWNILRRLSESNGRILRSADTDLALTLLKTSPDQNSLSHWLARLWSSLSGELKVTSSLSAFNWPSNLLNQWRKSMHWTKTNVFFHSWFIFYIFT